MSQILKDLNKLAAKMGAPIVGRNISEQVRAISTYYEGTTHGANIAERINEVRHAWHEGSEPATLVEKSIIQNGIYLASDDSADGYSKINVEVPPNVAMKSITSNGVYDASEDHVDGYSRVVVNIVPPAVVKPYIEFSGAQYIDTGFHPSSIDSKLKYELMFSGYVPNEKALNDWEYIFGGYSSQGNTRPGGLARMLSTSGTFNCPICSTEVFQRAIPSASSTNIHTFVLGKRNTGELYSALDGDYWGTYVSGSCLGNVGLGVGLDYNGDPLLTESVGYATINVFGFTITENDIIVKNFVPSTQNNVAGFIETVSNTFYPSEGSEEFAYGELIIP